jgi:putative radical SAM enzyme (TIGR03279 family)
MVQIEDVPRGSQAERIGLRPGDRIESVNGSRVRDVLDFHFQVEEEAYELGVLRGMERVCYQVIPEGPADLGLVLAGMKTRLCGNDCVFCFTYQNPEGMRPAIYVKDEDYRLSFLHGNFVTLSNLKEWEIRRIVEQRLSPLYVSIHSMNPETRQRMIRARRERDVRPVLAYLVENGIILHTQVVLVPGYNEGEDLERTVRELAAYHPRVASLAVVPLGTTNHREGLPELRRVTRELATEIVARIGIFQEEFRKRWGRRFVYLADEWYRLLDRPVPPETHYDGYPQLENGIGMTRHFLNRLGRLRRIFPDAGRRGVRRITLVTGELFRTTLETAVRGKLARSGEAVSIQVVGVPNRFFGRQVSVAGLLVGRDILESLRRVDLGDRVYLPPHTLNDDDLFLDDTSFADFRRELGVPVRLGFRDRHW